MPSGKIDSWPPRWLTPVDPKAIKNGNGRVAAEFAEAFGTVGKDGIAGRVGDQLVLRPWQRKLVECVYAANENKGLQHRTALIGLPRKNGKSAISSVAFGLYSLLAEGIEGGEVYSVASETGQARIVFDEAKRMVQSTELSEMVNIYRDAIYVPSTHSVYRVVSAEAYSKEGLNPSRVIMDELHAHKNRELFDVFSLAMGNRGDLASLIAITTAGVKTSMGQDSIAYQLYQYGQKVALGEVIDPTFFMAWWQADDDSDHTDPKQWRKANPGFNDLVDEQDFISAVRRTPEAEFRTKRLNQWVNQQDAWLPTGAWESLQSAADYNEDDEFILGFDGSWSNDSTALVGVRMPRDEEDKPHIFLIQLWEKQPEDDASWRVPTLEVEDAIVQFMTRYRNVREVVFDPPRWMRTMAFLEEQGFPVVAFSTSSAARMVPACQIFFDAVTEQKITHDGNPALTRHLANAVVKSDRFGRRITKEAGSSPRKIDAAVAAVIALDRAFGSSKLEEVIPQFYLE